MIVGIKERVPRFTISDISSGEKIFVHAHAYMKEHSTIYLASIISE